MILLIETQYFPCVNYLKLLKEVTLVELEQYERYQKLSFRNRCIVCGSNGLIPLTIPLVGGREQKLFIRDVKIDNTQGWQRSHIRSLTSAYNKAPFFNFYRGDMENLINSNEKFLFDLNFKILSFFTNLLKINTVISFTSEFKFKNEERIDARNSILPKNFQENSVDFLPRYVQVFEDRIRFQPNLSILDLLFCEGPNAANLLRKS